MKLDDVRALREDLSNLDVDCSDTDSELVARGIVEKAIAYCDFVIASNEKWDGFISGTECKASEFDLCIQEFLEHSQRYDSADQLVINVVPYMIGSEIHLIVDFYDKSEY
jgi:hypothetical protein